MLQAIGDVFKHISNIQYELDTNAPPDVVRAELDGILETLDAASQPMQNVTYYADDPRFMGNFETLPLWFRSAEQRVTRMLAQF